MLVLPVAWRELGSQVDTLAAALQAGHGSAPLVVGMNRYMLSSELAFYRHDPVSAAANTASQHLFGLSGLMYEQWFPVAQQQGRTLLLVALEKGELDDARLLPYVQSLGPVQSAVLRHNGRAISEYFYREADGYRAIPGP
jgi:dolichol-phosphate mannosyltransferase